MERDYPDPKLHYQLGMYVDAMDTRDTWCVGKILSYSESEGTIKVRFDGWNSKWDHTFPIISQKIAPFRLNTILYTGQSSFAIRDWNFSIQQVEDMELSLASLSESLGTGNPIETTQLLRGQLFTLVDCLLCHTYQNRSDKLRVYSFFEKVIQFCCKWLEKYSEIIPHIKSSFGDEEEYLLNDMTAVARSFPELSFTLSRLFGLDNRTAKFFDDYLLEDTDKSNMLKPKLRLGVLHHLTVFANLGGFDLAKQVFSHTQGEQKFPILLLEVLSVFKLSEMLIPEIGVAWLAYIKDKFLERWEAFEEEEVMWLDLNIFDNIVHNFRNWMDKHSHSFERFEQIQLDHALKMLMCPFLGMKLRGIGHIKEAIDSVTTLASSIKGAKWLNVARLVDWITRADVLENILKKIHVEVNKRLPPLITFMSKNRCLTDEHVAMVWDSAWKKHETLIIASYQTILRIVPSLGPTHRSILVEKIKLITESEFDSRFVAFIKDLSIKFLEVSKDTEVFGIKMLRELMMDSSSLGMQSLGTDCLAEVMFWHPSKEKQWEIIQDCLRSITSDESVPQHINLCLKLLENLCTSSSSTKESIKKLDNLTSGIFKFILESFERYLGLIPHVENPSKKALYGKSTHTKNIKKRFELLEFAIKDNILSMPFEIFESLWTLFVQHPVFPKDRLLFFRCIGENISKLLPILQQILEQCFAQELPPSVLSTEACECLKLAVIFLNKSKKKIEIKDKEFYSRTDPEILGLDTLFTFLLEVEEKSVEENLRNLLVQFNLKLSKAMANKREETWVQFLQVCLGHIQKDLKSTATVSRVLNLLLSFLEKPSTEDMTGHSLVFQAKTSAEDDYFRCSIRSTQTIAALRLKIANHYNKPTEQIGLVIGSKRYDRLEDDTLLSSLRSHYVNVEFLSAKKRELTPLKFLGSHAALYNTLFSLIELWELPSAVIAWELLSKLPISSEVTYRISTLKGPLTELFGTDSVFTLLYQLIALQKQLRQKNWMQEFAKTGGGEQLKEIYMNTECRVPSVTCKYHCVFISVLADLQVTVTPDLFRKVFASLLDIGKYTNQEDKAEPASAVNNASKLLGQAFRESPEEFTGYILDMESFDLIIQVSLLSCNNSSFSNAMVTLLLELAEKSTVISEFCLRTMLNLLDTAFSATEGRDCYWNLLSVIISASPVSTETTQTLERLITHIKNPLEENETSESVLSGVLSVIAILVRHTGYTISDEFFDLIYRECLFEIPSLSNPSAPKCKRVESRRSALDVLLEMCTQSQSVLEKVLRELQGYHAETSWRGLKPSDWHFSSKNFQKSETGYVGLKNLGNTCYMNTIFQQVFMVEAFRDAFLKIQVHSEKPIEETVTHQTQKLFSGLLHSDKPHINANSFCSVFKDWDGNLIDTRQQMDVEEFFNHFMETIDQELTGGPHQNLVKDHFIGSQVIQCIGQEGCSHKSEAAEDSLTIQLAVKNKKHVYESLQYYIDGDILEGDNAYQCDHCDNKVKAVRRICFGHLPNVLAAVLRRFEFNYEIMNKLKLYEFYEYPMELNMEPYTIEGVERREQGINELKYPEEYYKYKLKGVIVHRGTADSGHYYTFIRDKNTWYRFDDSRVTFFDINDLPSETFGGEDENWAGSTKKYSAYLILYEREVKYKFRSNWNDPLEELLPSSESPQEFQEIMHENNVFWICKFCFTSEYFNFVYSLLKLNNPQTFKFGVCFYFTVLVRSKDLFKLSEIFTSIDEHFQEDTADWLLELISIPEVTNELLVRCFSPERRKLILAVVQIALTKCSDIEKVLQRLLNQLKHISKYSEGYFELIYRIARLRRDLLPKYDLPSLLLRHYFGRSDNYPVFEIDNSKESDIGKIRNSLNTSPGTTCGYLFATIETDLSELTPLDLNQIRDVSNMLRIAGDSQDKFSARTTGKIYHKVCENHKEASTTYAKVLMKKINESDGFRQLPFLRQLVWLITIEDDLKAERTNFALTQLFDIMYKNKQYTPATEVCVDYLVKLSSKVPAVAEWIHKKNKQCRWLEQWAKETQKLQKKRTDDLRKMLKGNLTLWKEWDNDEEFPLMHWRTGQKVEVWDSDSWQSGTILFTVEEVALANFKSTKKLFDIHSENISLPK